MNSKRILHFFIDFYQLFYRFISFQKMGSQAMRCSLQPILTQQSTIIEPPTYEDETLDSCSMEIKVRDPLRVFINKTPQKIKTLSDVLEGNRYNARQFQQQLVNRVLQKSTKTMKSLKQINGSLDQSQHDPNLLQMIEEEIQRLVKERQESGSKNCRESIDRSQLFKRLNINLSNFVRTKGDNVKDHYDFKECIGEGSYGKVFRAICKRSQEQRAIKILKRREGYKKRQKSSFLAEFDLLSTLDHPNIVKLFEIYYHKGHYYVVMQYCKGGSLIDLIKKNKHFSEQSLAHIMRQLMSALAYLHAKNIVHRDIKLDNLVALNTEENNGFSSIKIIDFGTATKITPHTKGKIAGTRSYMAPQVFQGKLTVKSDVWSSGIFLYLLFMGKFPFVGNSIYDMERAVNSQVVTFASNEWGFVSKDAKKLLMGMLQKVPEKRLSAAETLSHPWFSHTKHSQTKITYELSNLRMLEKYHRGNNFIAVIENYLTSKQISQNQRDRLGQLFKQIDTNNDGVIEERELVDICQEHYGVETENEVKKILKQIDQNDSGKIDFNQFLLAMYSRKKLFLESSLIEAFKFYDLDQDGYLERSQLLELLAGCQREEVEYLLEQIDTDKDEKVSLDEFLTYMNKNSNPDTI